MRSHVIPRARRILAAQPLEHIQVPIFSSTKTSPLIPGARRIPAAQPLEHVQVTISGSSVTSRPLISLNQIFVSLAFGERVHQNLSLPLLPFLEHSNKCKEPICSDLALALLTLNVVFEFRFTLLNWYVWAALLSEPLEHLGLALDLRKVTGLPIPGARRVLAAQPLEHIQVTIRGSSIRSNVIPRARRILAAQPLEHVQVTPFGSVLTRDYIPGAAKRPAPAQNVQVPTEGGIGASPLIPRASALMQVLEHTQMPSISCSGASERIPQLPRTEAWSWPRYSSPMTKHHRSRRRQWQSCSPGTA